jgi:tRNA nucleotidyltransferase (CCA-adding enzyme)
MELIATHVGADFDAVASAVAARRLHPEARLFFPGSQQESVRRMIAAGALTIAGEVRQREVDPARLTRVVLCDIRQRDRIGVVAEWLAANPGIEVWAYDHHPAAESDLAIAGGIVDPAAGSTSTLLAEELARRGLVTSAAEATLLLAGIYEDTGSLTFPTTGARDLAAAARLLAAGGDLGAVRRFAVRHLDARHLEVLHEMASRLAVHRIHDHRVGVTEVELPGYVDELAPLVNRCLEIFDLPLLFALVGEGERVSLIGRGELPGFDLGAALGRLGGGGHATAGSARLRGVTLVEARERLLALLAETLPPAARAADLMIAPVFTLPAAVPIAEAKQLLNVRQVNAAPVTEGEDGPAVGAVTRQLLDAALQHGMGERPVSTVMERDLEWVAPEAPADEVGERMLGASPREPRFVLVGERASGRPLGIITRMQVLRHLHGRLADSEASLDRRTAQQKASREDAAHLLRRLPPPIAARTAAIARVSRRSGVPAYLVGGLVRDLLLGRENRDLDVVAEGDGPGFARLLARELGGRVRVHAAFLTAVVVDPEGFHVDVATARSEFYRAPAALPEVQGSAIRQDLYRRDFTVNTLAIRLGPPEGGAEAAGPSGREAPPELLDYFGGRRDLRERTLRVLHSLSFLDDPTRALRAVRLSLRLGFQIAPETLRLIDVALAEGAFERLSGSRLRDELALLLDDADLALRGLDRLAELGLLAVLHPRLALDDAARDRLRRARAALDWYRLESLAEPPVRPWRLFLAALTSGLALADPAGLAALCDRLDLAGADRRLLEGAAARVEAARRRIAGAGLAAHEVDAALAPLAGEELLLLMVEGGEGERAWVRRYLCDLRPLELAVRGADLLAAGVAPGPEVGRALAATRRARLDGEIGRDEELAHALAEARRGAAVGSPESTIAPAEPRRS